MYRGQIQDNSFDWPLAVGEKQIENQWIWIQKLPKQVLCNMDYLIFINHDLSMNSDQIMFPFWIHV